MRATLRLVLIALMGVFFVGCLIPVPVPAWDDGGGHRHHRHERDWHR
jgi:hypothetical protein